MKKRPTPPESAVFSALLLAAAFWLVGTGLAQASTASIICDVYNDELKGNLGPGLATMAIIGLSLSAIFGRATFGMAIMVAAGIAILYGARDVAGAFGVTGC